MPGISTYSPTRDLNASIPPGNIVAKEFANQQIVNSIRQLMADLAALGITPFIEGLLNDANAAAALTTLGVSTYIQTLLDDANAAAARTTLGLAAATYTPTLTAVSNVAAATVTAFYYIQVGTNVIVNGTLTIDPTAAAPTATILGITLPVPSNFTAASDAAGVSITGLSTQAGIISADTVNDRLQLQFSATNAANATHQFTAMYAVQ